jgi:hypothetical protein
MLKPNSSQSSGAHTFTKQAEEVLNKFSLTDDGRCFMGQGRNANRENHGTKDRNNVTSTLQITKKKAWAIQNKRCGMLTSGVVLLHDNARQHTTTCT